MTKEKEKEEVKVIPFEQVLDFVADSLEEEGVPYINLMNIVQTHKVTALEAEMIFGKHSIIKRADAKVDPEDENVPEIGQILAWGRWFTLVGNAMEQLGHGLNKHEEDKRLHKKYLDNLSPAEKAKRTRKAKSARARH